MDFKKLLVQEVFDKAKRESGGNTINAFCTYLETDQKIGLSYKTLERCYKKHTLNDLSIGDMSTNSTQALCQYLGYSDYKEYRNSKEKKTQTEIDKTKPNKTDIDPISPPIDKDPKNKFYIIGSIIAVVSLVLFITKSPFEESEKPSDNSNKCMVWVVFEYKETTCDIQFDQESGAKPQPYDKKLLKNFKKVEVTLSYPFFVGNNTKKPRVWYYKSHNNEIEYFTAPGLHPTNGATLKKITPHIIDTYVPKHIFKPTSFLSKNQRIKD